MSNSESGPEVAGGGGALIVLLLLGLACGVAAYWFAAPGPAFAPTAVNSAPPVVTPGADPTPGPAKAPTPAGGR